MNHRHENHLILGKLLAGIARSSNTPGGVASCTFFAWVVGVCLVSPCVHAMADMPEGQRSVQSLQSTVETDSPNSATDAASAAAEANSVQAKSIEELERQLRGNDFQLRQQAMMQLWSNRELYRGWVEQAVNDPDAEVARRASWILDRWKLGLLPNLPANVIEKLQSTSGPETIEFLLNYGVFSGATVAIDEAIRSGRGQALVERAKSALRRRFPFYVRLAHEKNELPVLIQLISRLRDDVSFALAHERLIQQLPTPEAVGSMPSRLADPSLTSDTRIKLMAALGELEAAEELAKQTQSQELLRVCQMLGGRWEELMQSQLEAVATEPSGSTDFYRHWMYILLGADRSGNFEQRQKAIELLKASRGDRQDKDSTDPVNRIRWQSLALHGEVLGAGEILQKMRARDAAEMLSSAGRYQEAFAALDVPLDQLNDSKSRLLTAAVRAERNRIAAQDARSSTELGDLLAFCRLLVSIGEDHWARQTLRELNENLFAIDDEARSATRVEMINTVARLNRSEWVLDFIVEDAETMISDRTKFFLAVRLDSEIETVDALLDALMKLDPSRSFAERMRAVTSLLLGKQPEWVSSKKDFEFIYASLITGAILPAANLAPANMRIRRLPRLSLDIARIFEINGQGDLARQTRQSLADGGDLNAKLMIAEMELTSGSVEQARKLFADVWQQADQQGQELSRLNMADNDAVIAAKALVGEAIAARRLNDQDEADSLEGIARLIGCAPSAALQNSFAEYLIEKGRRADAEEILGPLLRLIAFGSTDDVEFYTVARQYDATISKTKPVEAAAALDLAVSGTMETTEFYPSAYVSLPVYVHRRIVTAGLKQKDQELVKRQIDSLLTLYPVDIDFAEKMLEPLREAGMEEIAQTTLDRIYEAGRSHLQKFPSNVAMLNNLAWVMSLSDYKLDEALQYSQRAVRGEPDSTVYRDTLAEILFRLGRKQEAINIERACLLDDPAEWHVHQQIERFQTKSPQDKVERTDIDEE